MENLFDFGKLAKEIIVSRLGSIPDVAPVTREIVRKTIVAGVLSTRVRQPPRQTVRETCRGALTGLVMIDKDLAKAAVAILDALAEASLETHIAPQEMLTWGLEGIAPVVSVAPGNAAYAVREALRAKYMGVAPVFDRLCEAAKKPG